MGLLLLIAVSLVYIVFTSRHMDAVTEKKELKTKTGLKVQGVNFTLEDEPFRIMSGALHYFRVSSGYWDDRMIKAKAMGLNTIETYIPWNMHEPRPGVFNFRDDLSISNFIMLAQIYGLYVIIRPGPYICAEWDLGGLPSWLLRDPEMQLRSSYKPFLRAVDRYFDHLMPILERFQFSHGGPVIAFQIENEYGSYGSDSQYMKYLKKAFLKRGITELLFTSDNDGGLGRVSLEGVLQTINLQTDVDRTIEKLRKIQKILNSGASFNLYMFHGGTNYGFMNGANTASGNRQYQPTISSYDYNAPVSETGDLTEKYHAMKKVILQYAPKGSVSNKLPWVMDSLGRNLYGKLKLTKYMPLKSILKHIKDVVSSSNVMPMEMLPINRNAGQSYGYTLYSTSLSNEAKVVTIFDAADRVTVILNDEILNDIDTFHKRHVVKLPSLKAGKSNQLQILVENCGRVNYGHAIDDQRKGIRGHVEVDGEKKTGWTIYPLEFKRKFINKIDKDINWSEKLPKSINTPALYKTTLYVRRAPHDVILHIKGFERGAVFVNGHNMGRYDKAGPQETIYIPRTLLRSGDNSILLFEQGSPSSSLEIDTVSDLIFGKTIEFEI
eukprot:gene10739-11888_t